MSEQGTTRIITTHLVNRKLRQVQPHLLLPNIAHIPVDRNVLEPVLRERGLDDVIVHLLRVSSKPWPP